MSKAFSHRFDHGTFWPILGAVLSGLVLVALAVVSFYALCGSGTQASTVGMCGIVHANPPWLAMTGLASSPPLVLIWYWRNKHRKRDLEQKDLERAHEESESRREKLANARASVDRTSKEMFGSPSECASALVALDRAGENAEVLQDVADALSNFLRGEHAGAAGMSQTRHDANRRRALERLSVFRSAHGIVADLSHANLHGMTLSNLNLSGADLTHANLKGTTLVDVNLAGAKMLGVEAKNCSVDERTLSTLTDEENIIFQVSGASRQPTGREQVRLLAMKD